jgi:hypothetical protein
MHCGIIELAPVEGGQAYPWAWASGQCSDWRTHVCVEHAETCNICNETFCRTCFSFHEKSASHHGPRDGYAGNRSRKLFISVKKFDEDSSALTNASMPLMLLGSVREQRTTGTSGLISFILCASSVPPAPHNSSPPKTRRIGLFRSKATARQLLVTPITP